jgi:hypothetical protein
VARVQGRVHRPGRHDELDPGGDGGRVRRLVLGAQAGQRSRRITEAIWASLEIFPLKKITPAACPALICRNRADGTVSPE